MKRLEALLQQLCPDGVIYKRLGDIATITRGGNFQKKDYRENGFPCIHYGQIYTKFNLFVTEPISHISDEKAAQQKKAKQAILLWLSQAKTLRMCASALHGLVIVKLP